MDCKVILSLPAIRDLAYIAHQVAADDAAAAGRVGLDLDTLAESRAVMPSLVGMPTDCPGSRRLVRPPYLVIYRIDESQRVVFVQRFWHAKRDPETWRRD